MKKSIKKACAIALLATSTAVVGANGVILQNNIKPADKLVYAEQSASALTMLEIDSQSQTATVGSTCNVPQARLVVPGSSIELNQTHYTVVSPIGESVDVSNGQFKVERAGTYLVNYEIENDGKVYKATAEIKGQIGKNTIELVENTQRTLPKYVWQSYKRDLYIPKAEVKFAEDEFKTDYDITTTVTTPSQETLTFNEETGLLSYTALEEGIYSVTYEARTKDGVYLNSRTEEFTVLSDVDFEKEYGIDYTLKFDYSKTVNTSADIGEEIELPTPVGKMGNEETPIYYNIEAYVYINGSPVDVTEYTMNGTKFTAQKTYTIGGQTYTVDNGRYLFYYNVFDALGKEAERTGFEISGVKDTKAPTVIVADPYSVDNVENIKNVDYKLQTNFSNGQNVILKAIYAEDLSDDLKDLELVRYIRSDSQSSSSKDIYSDEGQEDENIFTKDIIFNMTSDFEFDENTMVDAKDLGIDKLENGSYTAYYRAKDSSGNTVTVNYVFNVSSTFEFTSAPTVEFKDTFSKSVATGERITFNKPVASDENDDRLYTQVMFKYDNDVNWTVLEANEDGKFEILVDKAGATSLKIRAKTENDAPLTSAELTADNDIQNYTGFKYGYDEVEILIKDNKDTQRPTITSLSDWRAEPYKQNEEVVLPTLTLTDDLIDYVDVNISVTHVEEVDGKKTTQDFDVEDATVIRSSSSGIYTLSGAHFYATLAGNYDVVYEITDAGNNKTYIYQSVNVQENSVVEEPRFSNLPEALSNGKLELGESIVLPVPEITGGGDNATYEVNIKGPVGSQINKESFTPNKEGTYTIVYSLYDEGTEIESERKEFKVEVSDTTGPEVRVDWNLKASYEVDSKVLIPVFEPVEDESGFNMENSKIVISSKSFTRTIKGTEMAGLLEQYKLWLKEEQEIAEGTLDENDREHPNPGNLYVTLSNNQLYTVTYTVYDDSVNQNSTVITHTIKVGDLVAPVLNISDDIVAKTVKIDTVLAIDLSKISVSDDRTEGMTVSDVKIVLKGPSGEVANIHEEEDNGKYEFNIETAGNYTLTFSATDDAGNTKTETREFTVNEPSNDGLTTNETITIVLCCVAVLVLAGSIVYFVVSKKKIQSYK